MTRAPAALSGTSMDFGAIRAAVLPFAPAASASPPGPPRGAELAPGEPLWSTVPRPSPASAPPAPSPTLTLQQYASLCAELAVFPDRTEAIFQQYGLGNLPDRVAVGLAWQERLRHNPEEHQGWQRIYQRWLAHFEELKASRASLLLPTTKGNR